MFDILEDSTCENSAGSSLEIDRVKEKIKAIWTQIINAEYNDKYATQKDDDEDYVSLEDYITENKLYFPGDAKPENEVDGIVKMLEDMFDPKEELESVQSEGKAPTYSGKQLSANNDKGKIEATVYESEHSMTKTPGDSQTSAKSSTYEHHGGKIAPRKDSKVKTSFAPMIEKIVEELLELEDRQNIGRRRELFRL